jgi:hypothetical protein
VHCGRIAATEEERCQRGCSSPRVAQRLHVREMVRVYHGEARHFKEFWSVGSARRAGESSKAFYFVLLTHRVRANAELAPAAAQHSSVVQPALLRLQHAARSLDRRGGEQQEGARARRDRRGGLAVGRGQARGTSAHAKNAKYRHDRQVLKDTTATPELLLTGTLPRQLQSTAPRPGPRPPRSRRPARLRAAQRDCRSAAAGSRKQAGREHNGRAELN